MATPLEVLKANKLANQQKLSSMLQSQGGYGDRIGRGLVGLAGAAAGAFTDPDVKAYEEFQQAQPARQSAQERNANVEQGGGAFGLSQSVGGQTLQENPQAVDRYLAQQNQGLMANMSPDMRPAASNQQAMQEASFTQEGMMEMARKRYQSGDVEGANQALAYAKALTPQTADGFTLAPDAVRFDARGNEVARNPKAGGSGIGTLVKNTEISDGGYITVRNEDGSIEQTKVLGSAKVGDSGKASAVTKIYGNGTTIQALPNGNVVVKSPRGDVLIGQERLDALKEANDFEINSESLTAGSKKRAEQAIEQSGKNFEKLGAVNKSIGNINKAIEAIDNGADTGFIASALPSIRSSSIILDNIQKSMGLDVVGNTTFGALSKGELDLALSKALPVNLDEPDLRAWLVDKRNAQEKLANYLEDVTIFLGTPGNDIRGWLEAQKAIESQTDKNILEVDF